MTRKCPTCATVYDDAIAFCGNDGHLTIQQLPNGDSDARLGTKLGEYVLVAQIADGAMGRVYEGRHAQTKQRVAIKVLHAFVAQDGVAVERFKREADTARELEHPHVVKVLDFGQTDDGSHFMTMEYLQGEELGGRIRRDGALPAARIVRILAQLAEALDHAHSFGVIHRDLKPDNVFLVRGEDGDVVRILDFGSVKLQVETGNKLTAFGTTLGSPYYMSPEQAMGKLDVDARTDVFACSAILYEMLTGKIAFEAGNVAQVLMKIMNEEPAGPSFLVGGLPGALDDVVDKGLRKDKNRRYGSVRELADGTVRAFGLTGAAATWAHKPQSEVEAALAQAVPPPPKPFGAESLPPPSAAGKGPAPAAAKRAAAAPAANAMRADDDVELPVAPSGSRAGLFIALAVVAVAGLGVVGFLALR